jgi:broad specificity phosphatase PhoE
MGEPALILVRHGRPKIDLDAPPTTWSLCHEGQVGCAQLAEQIVAYKPTAVVASPEPKALETAQILAHRLGLEVVVDEGLHEHKRPAASFGSEQEFRDSIAKVFAQPAAAASGGESTQQAAERLAKTLAKYQGKPLLAVTHGTVLSLYLAERLGVDAHDLWRSLHMPDAFVLDDQGALVTRLG